MRVIARMNVGGPAWQATALTRGLDPSRFETRLVTGHVAADETDYLTLRAPDLPVTRIASLGRRVRLGGDGAAFVRLVREMRAFEPHIVHTHTAKAGALGTRRCTGERRARRRPHVSRARAPRLLLAESHRRGADVERPLARSQRAWLRWESRCGTTCWPRTSGRRSSTR